MHISSDMRRRVRRRREQKWKEVSSCLTLLLLVSLMITSQSVRAIITMTSKVSTSFIPTQDVYKIMFLYCLCLMWTLKRRRKGNQGKTHQGNEGKAGKKRRVGRNWEDTKSIDKKVLRKEDKASETVWKSITMIMIFSWLVPLLVFTTTTTTITLMDSRDSFFSCGKDGREIMKIMKMEIHNDNRYFWVIFFSSTMTSCLWETR